MIGVSNTFGGSSILSSPADKKRQKPWIYKVSGVFIYIRKVDLAVRLIWKEVRLQQKSERQLQFSKIRQKHNKDFVMGYAFNLCKNQILIVPCN